MSRNSENFWDHVEALRTTLLRILTTIGLTMLLALLFYRPVLDFFLSPLENTAIKTEKITQSKITNTSAKSVQYQVPHEDRLVTLKPFQSMIITQTHTPQLAIFTPTEGLMTILRVCLWVGMTASSPVWLFWIYRFVAPALHQSEKRIFIPFILLSIGFSVFGFIFCYKATIPMANLYLNTFNEKIGINFWGLSHYLNYSLILLLANALAFELCAVLLFLVHFGKITDSGMRKHRPTVIVCIFVLSAVLTPPDVFTQFMLGIPLVGFYELGILYARFKQRKAALELLP